MPSGTPKSARAAARSRPVAGSKNRSSAAFGTYATRPRQSGKDSPSRSMLNRETDRIRSAWPKTRARRSRFRGGPWPTFCKTSWLVTARRAWRVGMKYSAGQ
jgi:hypothetical protein